MQDEVTAADFPYEVWQCVECAAFLPMTVKAVLGVYPEDGEVFCSVECREQYDARTEGE